MAHPSPPNRSLTPSAALLPIERNRFALELRGYLKPGWSGRLATRLSDEGINVLRGVGRKVSAIDWDARFELLMPASIRNPERLNYLEMACAPFANRPSPGNLILSSRTLHEDDRHNGSLRVEVGGPDRLGFLASLLRVFSFYSLFPVEMEIETVAATASNRFWLKGIGSLTPSAEDRANLQSALAELAAHGGQTLR